MNRSTREFFGEPIHFKVFIFFLSVDQQKKIIYIYIYIYIYTHIRKVKLATIVEGDQKALFSIATTLRCRGGCYSFPWIAPLYP